MAPGTSHALIEQRGHVLIVTMNRPESRNALSGEMLQIMVDAWDRVDNDPEIRVCILTGAGGYFCAGMDLKAATKAPPGDSFKSGGYDPTRIDGLLKGRRLTKPLIAEIRLLCLDEFQVQDITNAMVEDFKLTDVLRMILETMFRAMEFQRIIFCMRDPKIEALTGRFGLGEGVERVVKSFSVTLKGSTPDLFTAVCTKGADTMISDATETRIADRLPVWYRKSINAPTFLLLPLIIKGKPFGLIYADKGEKGGLILDEKELALLRTLRNQAVMAFKQSS